MRNLLRVCVATLAAISLMSTFTGCTSGSGDDIVYLHVIHGYAGGGAVTVFGPSGTIANNLKFGEAEGPIAFDRSTYQGNMSLQLEGLPGIVSKSIDLYSLYPGEHATLLLQRRTSLTDLEVDVLRHHQLTIDQAAPPQYRCSFELSNALSLTNASSDSRFEFMTEWRLTPAQSLAFYDESKERFVETECGPLNLEDIPTIGPDIIERRKQTHNEIQAQPWFFPVASMLPGEELLLSFVKGNFIAPGGQVIGYRPTREYKECLSQAVQIEQDPNAMMASTTQCDSTGGVPRDSSGRPRVLVDPNAVNECLRQVGYTGRSQLPADPNASTIYYYNPDATAGNSCNQSMRLRTHSVDAIFDPPLQQPTRDNGKLVQIDLKMPQGAWQYVVVYGRPVAPLVYMFTSDDLEGGLTEDWSAPEYPNDTIPPEPGTPRVQVVSGGM